jgi:hypothetical protein
MLTRPAAIAKGGALVNLNELVGGEWILVEARAGKKWRSSSSRD